MTVLSLVNLTLKHISLSHNILPGPQRFIHISECKMHLVICKSLQSVRRFNTVQKSKVSFEIQDNLLIEPL